MKRSLIQLLGFPASAAARDEVPGEQCRRSGTFAFAHMFGLAAKPARGRMAARPVPLSFDHLGGGAGPADSAVPPTSPEPTKADLAAAERAGRRAERKRLTAILSSPEAAENWPEAMMLAFECPLMSSATVRGVLASLPPPPSPLTPHQRRMAEAAMYTERARIARTREYEESGGEAGAFAREAAAVRARAEALGVTGMTQPTGGPTINVGGRAPRVEEP